MPHGPVLCQEVGCRRPHHAARLCEAHYRAKLRREERDNGPDALMPLLFAESFLDGSTLRVAPDGPVLISATVDASQAIRCPDCNKRFGLHHGWGWHCRNCHRTWPAGQPCECGISTDWRRKMAMVPSTGKRTRPAKAIQTQLLDDQRNRCYYCQFEFGTVFRRKTATFALKLEWDHFIPFSYSLSNDTDNWVAACHVCNRIKGCLIFRDVETARAFINARRDSKGYELHESERQFLEAQR